MQVQRYQPAAVISWYKLQNNRNKQYMYGLAGNATMETVRTSASEKVTFFFV